MTDGGSMRTVKDSMGEMQVPADALYGASTARAVENFPISDLRFSRPFLRALGLIKGAAASVNVDLGLLALLRGQALLQTAGDDAEAGHLAQHVERVARREASDQPGQVPVEEQRTVVDHAVESGAGVRLAEREHACDPWHGSPLRHILKGTTAAQAAEKRPVRLRALVLR